MERAIDSKQRLSNKGNPDGAEVLDEIAPTYLFPTWLELVTTLSTQILTTPSYR
jgi:hypothetical protein